MLSKTSFRLAAAALAAVAVLTRPMPASAGEPLEGKARLERAQEFHFRAQQSTGLLVPLYVYPSDPERNPAYETLIELKRQHRTVPVWVIVNPASGPGEREDPNYSRAIARLQGAGCVVLGYVTTSYAKRSAEQVQADIDLWRELYPRVQGVFFDEMTYEDTPAAAAYQAGLTEYAHGRGWWPCVANPGADTPGRYFAEEAADVIVVHEGSEWPSEERMAGKTEGGYADFPPFARGVLLHTLGRLDPKALASVQRHAGWVYVTEGPFRPGDPTAANPWDRLSAHTGTLFDLLDD